MPFGVAAAAAGAVGAIGGALISSSAAKSAASTQANAANRAADMSQANYDQTRSDLAPYRDVGATAIPVLQGQMDHLTAPFNPDQATLEATPGYQFTRDQGLQAVQNAASARGLGISGSALKDAAKYATGLADSTYQTQFNIDQANKTNAYNKLLGLVGVGQSSAAQTGAFGQQATANAGNFLTSGANASAAGQIGGANAIAGGLNNAGSNATNMYLMNKLIGGGGGSLWGGGGGGLDSAMAHPALSGLG